MVLVTRYNEISIRHRIDAVLLTVAALLSAWAFQPSPAASQTPVNPSDPLWLQQAQRHWYDEQVMQGKASPTLLFGLQDRINPGSYGMSTLGEMERLFATDPPHPHSIDWKTIERKALLALPLLRSGNGLPLLFRPQGDLYATYGKRLAASRVNKSFRMNIPEGAVVVDTHVHTCYSHDSLADPTEMVLAGARDGLSGIAITDHDTMAGARKALEMLPKLIREGRVPPTFFVIPGEEVSSADGHVVGLFLTHDIAAGMSAERTVALIHEQGGIAIAAHPATRDSLGKLAATLPFDAVETENAAEDIQYVMEDRSSRLRHAFYGTVAKPHIGASDAHDPGGVATSYTLLLDCAPTEAGVRAAILGARTEAVASLDHEKQRRMVRTGLPHVLFVLGTVFGSDTQGIGAWSKDATHADTARMSLLPHPEIYWSRRF